VAAIGTLSTAQAAPAPTDPLQANSYAELLQPIPNAVATLQAIDEQAPPQATDGDVQVAQYYHHHHHHHHGYYRRGPVIVIPHRRYYHHHHHGYYHHHHHHHHHGYYRRY